VLTATSLFHVKAKNPTPQIIKTLIQLR